MINKYNRIGLMILIAVLISIISIPTASALPIWDGASFDEVEKEYRIYNWLGANTLVEVKQISNTEQCITNCEEKLRIIPDINMEITEDSDFLWTFTYASGVEADITTEIYWEELETSLVNVTDYRTECTNKEVGTLPNSSKIVEKTCQEVIAGTHIEETTITTQHDYYGYTLEKNKVYNLTLKAKKSNINLVRVLALLLCI